MSNKLLRSGDMKTAEKAEIFEKYLTYNRAKFQLRSNIFFLRLIISPVEQDYFSAIYHIFSSTLRLSMKNFRKNPSRYLRENKIFL